MLDGKDEYVTYLTKKFMDEMPGGFFIYHADGDEEIIYANIAVLRLFGCQTLEEFRRMTGNSFRGMVHPDDLYAVEQSIRHQIIKSQYDLDHVEYRIICKDGSVRWIDDYGHFVHHETFGDIFYVFIGDITEKKQRELAEKEWLLREKQQKEQELQYIHTEHLRRLEVIEGLSIDYESIFYVDLDADMIKAYRVGVRFRQTFPKERHICAFSGFDRDYICTWVYPEDREIVANTTRPEFIREHLSNHRSIHINYRIVMEEKITYIQLRIVNVGSREHISQIIMGYRNIDDEVIQELKQQQKLKDALNQANLANQAKTVFLSNMSHDIRTPMNAIVGYTNLARKYQYNPQKVDGYLNMILSSSDSLLQLLDNVLEIARIESKQVHIVENECSLLEIARNIEKVMQPKTAAKSIRFSLDVSGLTHDMVYGDQQKITQVLLCLTDNALKYSLNGSHIDVSVIEQKKPEKQNSSYQFVVEDGGIGMSEDFLERIFDPFERERNTTLSGIHGSGLGLTIAKRIVDMMGGTIDVSSAAGDGSQFTVTLNLRVKEVIAAQPNENQNIRQDATQKTILLTDDNELNLEIAKEILMDAGYRVDTAENGSIAVDKIQNSAPGSYDLVLMDLQMPVMNGYDAAKAIRSLSHPTLANIPIVALSANVFETDKKMALESGMNAHLEKPIDTHKLYETIESLLKQQHLP